jgi:ParB-like chromosome segregation protein Spo0J
MPKNRAHRSAQRSPQLRIEELDPVSLQPYAANARMHPPRQLQQLVASLSCFGFVVPALINANGEIIAGHARVEAAKALGLNRIPLHPGRAPQQSAGKGLPAGR